MVDNHFKPFSREIIIRIPLSPPFENCVKQPFMAVFFVREAFCRAYGLKEADGGYWNGTQVNQRWLYRLNYYILNGTIINTEIKKGKNMKENKAYYLGLASIGLFLIATVLGTAELMSDSVLRGIGIASLGVAIGAFFEGRKELLNDPKNKKSKVGYIIGIVMLSFQVLAGVVLLLMESKNLVASFELIRWIGFIATLVALIVFAVQKKPLKILFIILGGWILFIIFVESLTDSSPGMFFGMTGFLGFITMIVLLIIFRIQKKPLKIPFIFLGVSIGLFILGSWMIESSIVSPISQTTTQVTTDESSADRKTAALAKSMQKYEMMSIETFESLPRQERLIYAQYLINKTRNSGDYEKIYAGENAEFANRYTEASINDSGQEIMDNYELNLQYAAAQHLDKKMTSDTEEAKKLLSIPFLYIGNDEYCSGIYLQEKNILERNSEVFVFYDNVTILETSDTSAYSYDSNTVLPAKIVKFTDNNDGVTKYAEFALTEIINEDKSVQYSWSLIAIAATAEALENVIQSLDGLK